MSDLTPRLLRDVVGDPRADCAANRRRRHLGAWSPGAAAHERARLAQALRGLGFLLEDGRLASDPLEELRHRLLRHAVALRRRQNVALLEERDGLVFPACLDHRLAAELIRLAHVAVDLHAALEALGGVGEAPRLQVGIPEAEVSHLVGRVGRSHLLELCDAFSVHVGSQA